MGNSHDQKWARLRDRFHVVPNTAGVVASERVLDRDRDPCRKPEVLSVTELQVLIPVGIRFRLRGSDERSRAPDQMLAHEAFPIIGILRSTERGESGDLPVSPIG